MKNRKRFSLLFSLLFLLGVSLQIQANSGRVIDTQGHVTVNGRVIETGHKVKQGDTIKTGFKSSAKIIMEDKSVLDIQPFTDFEITKYSFDKDKSSGEESNYSLFKGAFRYVSGLMNKRNPGAFKVTTATATIGIRGSYDTIAFDGDNVQVDTAIGTATITFANGETLNISAGQTGRFNVSTGQSSVGTTTTPDTVALAALAIAANPDDADAVKAALADLSSAEQAIAMATLINNASQLGLSTANLVAATGNAVAANPANGAALTYVATALSPDNAQQFTDAAAAAAPEQATDIRKAGDEGVKLVPPTTTKSNDDGTSATGTTPTGTGTQTDASAGGGALASDDVTDLLVSLGVDSKTALEITEAIIEKNMSQ